jgi:hypothetical protein
MRAWLVGALVGALALGPDAGTAAQGARTFRARLSPVPIDLSMVDKITGAGVVRATLIGTKLTVSGEFSGLQSPATAARVHRARKGMNGPAVFDLQVTRATSGEISGAAELTPSQVEDLAREWFYVLVHSEAAPDGNLRGWLLPLEIGR